MCCRFAYVDLGSEEVMERVISRSEEVFEGRNLLIKNGKSFVGRPAEKKQRYQIKTTTTIRSPQVVRKSSDGVSVEKSAVEKSEVVRPPKRMVKRNM